MKKLTTRQRQRELKAVAAIPDERIDTSEIPELTPEQLRRAVSGQMYRPVKRPVTMRLDTDVIAWLKEDGRGYQTKANALLRKQMLRAFEEKKGPERADAANRNRRTKKARSR